jgi:glyoxylase I family protein
MKFEHFAINTADARAVTRWYVEHLGLKIARQMDVAPYTAFLADETGRTIIEIYARTDAVVPDYAAVNPLVFHIAFVSTDNDAIRARLVAAGADRGQEDILPDGTKLLMMRDPWGVPLQFCHRAKPFGHVV